MFGPFVGIGLRAYNRAQALIDYLFRDDFTTDEAAPIASPRTCEPGPGSWIITDTSNLLSISGGKIAWSGAGTVTDPAMASSSAYVSPRTAGLYFSGLINSDDNLVLFGFDATQTDATPDSDAIGINIAGSNVQARDDAGAVVLVDSLPVAASTDYIFAVALRTAGAFYFIKGGVYTSWTLYWVSNTSTRTGLYLVLGNYTSTGGHLDKARVGQLPPPFDTDNGLATDSIASPIVTDTFTHEADCIIEFTVDTLPPISKYHVMGFRAQDSNNYWQASIYSDGTLHLVEIVSAGGTIRASASMALSGGERIVIICDDETITGYYDNTQAWSYSSASNFKTETNGLFVVTGGTLDFSNLITWPRTLSGTANVVLNRYTA